MKKNIIVLLVLIFFVRTYSQEKQLTRKFTTTSVEKIDFTKIYNKNTGVKIKEKEFRKIIKKLKNYNLEPIVGENGDIEKFLFDPNDKSEIKSRDSSLRVNTGDFFPNFNIKTITNKDINLKDLKGKIVILRFELFADNFRFKKNEIIDLDNQINQIENNEDKIKAIIIFTTPKNEILKGFDIEDSNFDLVANGMNFNERYLVTRYPTTIIIDEEGKLVDYFSYSEDIILKKLIK